MNTSIEIMERVLLAKTEADKSFMSLFNSKFPDLEEDSEVYYIPSKISEVGSIAKELVLARFRGTLEGLLYEELNADIQTLDGKMASAISASITENNARIKNFAEKAAFEEFTRLFKDKFPQGFGFETYSEIDISNVGRAAKCTALDKYRVEICEVFTQEQVEERQWALEGRMDTKIHQVETTNKAQQTKVIVASASVGTSVAGAVGCVVGGSIGAIGGPPGVILGGAVGATLGAGVGAVSGAVTGAIITSKDRIRSWFK